MMEISCCLPPGPRTVEYAQLAEALGFRRLWLYDSPLLYPDVWMTLACVAQATTTLEIGPGVLVPGLRHVATTAGAIATLETLAPGRVAVAVGTGSFIEPACAAKIPEGIKEYCQKQEVSSLRKLTGSLER